MQVFEKYTTSASFERSNISIGIQFGECAILWFKFIFVFNNDRNLRKNRDFNREKIRDYCSILLVYGISSMIIVPQDIFKFILLIIQFFNLILKIMKGYYWLYRPLFFSREPFLLY